MPISGKTRVVGIMGYPVEHSRSPIMHNAALAELGLDWVYVPFSVDPANIADAVTSVRILNLVGANVTVPFKESVAPQLDQLSPSAQRINSVNTIVNRNGVLTGYSTDGDGLLWDLRDKSILPPTGSDVLVLGAGGSARAVVGSFVDAGYVVNIANRTELRAQRLVQDLDIVANIVRWDRVPLFEAAHRATLVVNTTTIGMNAGDEAELTVFESGWLGQGKTFYDLVYKSPVTPLMRRAQHEGSSTFNGLGMLVRQGALSLSLWSGIDIKDLPIATMESAIFGAIS